MVDWTIVFSVAIGGVIYKTVCVLVKLFLVVIGATNKY